MCGFGGKLYFDTNRCVELNELKKMTFSINHRGPDDEGYYLKNNVGLGFRRLSIIDIEGGHQPLSSTHSNFAWITFNGEIYNYRELKNGLHKKGYIFKTNTDTEVIINLFLEYGERCLDFLQGMFAFVIWDDKNNQLFGARDRLGIKPLFYYLDNDQFVWGSEIKAINSFDGINRSINKQSLDSYFSYGYITGNNSTIYNCIKKLMPGTYFTIKPHVSNDVKINKYWSMTFNPDYSISENQWVDSIVDSLQSSVSSHLVSDVPVGAFLSGGIDSSAVVALMSNCSDSPVKTFSVQFQEEKYNEIQYARLIAKKYNTDHHEMIVEPESIELLPLLINAYDEPFADSSAIPTYYISKFAREHVKVVLSGDGGDELFAGYNSFNKMIKLYNGKLNNSFLSRYAFKHINRVVPDYMFGKGYTYYLSKEPDKIGAYFCVWKDYERDSLYKEEFKEEIDICGAERNMVQILESAEGDFLSNMQELHINTYLVDDILTKVDRASMINSLETRVPILDHRFVELTSKIPSSLKINRTDKKYIFKKAMSTFLPPAIIQHRKQGFAVPIKYWFKDNLKDYINDTLLEVDSPVFNYINKSVVINTIKYHNKGIRDYSSKIWSLLFLNEWLRQNN